MASNRIRNAVAAAALLAGTAGLLLSPTAQARQGFALERVFGDDRYETAAAIASVAFPGGADSVVLATGEKFPDALAGSYLAGAVNGPILLTQQNTLPAATSQSLQGLDADNVYILGGASAVSTAVEDQLTNDGYTVLRIEGDDRYDTASQIARNQAAGAPGSLGGDVTAILASGESFADALAAGPLSYVAALPILLTTQSELSADAQTAIEELEIDHVVVVGGSAVVSDDVIDEVEALGATTERVFGQTRYETATEIADFALAEIDAFGDDGVDLATGEKFADAMTGGPAAGEALQPILLTQSASLSAATEAWLEANADTLIDGRVFGGSGAVSDAVVAAAEVAASGEGAAGTFTGQLTSFDRNGDAYTMVPTGADEAKTVRYASGDTFEVNGDPATIGGFESALSAGDQVTHVEASGDTPASHSLTDVPATSFTSGTVGNVDIDDEEFDFINPVTGDILRQNLSWADASWQVDGADRSQPHFEANINEGDTLVITAASGENPAVYRLTNRTVSGLANAIEIPNDAQNALSPVVRLKIDALGDDPALSSDAGTTPDPDGSGNDDKYEANGGSSNDEFVVDGADSDYAAFRSQLSEGDLVTYTRTGSGADGTTGQETFTLTNRAPTTQTGQAVDDLDSDGSDSPLDEDGGSFTIATETGTYEVEYEASGSFVVDGRVSNEEEFEAAYSAGDVISFRPADNPSGTTQRLTLTNEALAGTVSPSSIRTEDSSSGLPNNTPGNSYAVLAENGTTELERVEYGDGESDQYFVNGQAATLDQFEAELTAIKGGEKSGTVIVQRTGTGDAQVEQHRLTTRTIDD